MICAVVKRSAGTQGTAGQLTNAFDSEIPPNKDPRNPLTWNDAITAMNKKTPKKLIPEVRCNYQLSGTDPVQIFPPPAPGSIRRALLIGSDEETKKIDRFLRVCDDFRYDPEHPERIRITSGEKSAIDRQWPTKRNIEESFSWLAAESKPGDVAFIYYSGPCGNIGEYDFLVPLSADKTIDDDDIQNKLLFPLVDTGGVFLRVLLDAPNCGSLFELPDGLHNQMTLPDGAENQQNQAFVSKVSAYTDEGRFAKFSRKVIEFFAMLNVIFLSGDQCLKSLVLLLGSVSAVVTAIGGIVLLIIKL